MRVELSRLAVQTLSDTADGKFALDAGHALMGCGVGVLPNPAILACIVAAALADITLVAGFT